jgi:oligopeptide/dipeptide ABC transporter ATP-binding protein
VVLITHDLGIVADMADRVAVMYAGQIVEETDTRTLFRDPKHPYTRGLIGSVPVIGVRRTRLDVIPGRVPNLIGLPDHCRFAPRCRAREELGLTRCTEAMPALVEVEPGHKVRCFIHSDAEEPPYESPVDLKGRPLKAKTKVTAKAETG